jgi:hypothetical protein
LPSRKSSNSESLLALKTTEEFVLLAAFLPAAAIKPLEAPLPQTNNTLAIFMTSFYIDIVTAFHMAYTLKSFLGTEKKNFTMLSYKLVDYTDSFLLTTKKDES